MTQRERLLFGSVVGVLGLAASVKAVHSWFIAPRQALIAQRAAERARADALDLELARAQRSLDSWAKQTQHTLSHIGYEAHGKFRAEISALVAKHAFTDVTVRESPAHVAPKGHREGFAELPVSVSAKASLRQLVAFLRDLYERPYFVRVGNMRINGENANLPVGSGKDKHVPVEPTLNISFSVETLVLPNVAGAPGPTLDLANVPEIGERIARGEKPALRREALEEYDEVARVNFFKLYTPPPAPKPDPVTTVVKNDTPKPTKPEPPPKPAPPPVDPRKNADKLMLVGVTTLNGEPMAFVEDEGKPTEAPEQYRLNDAVDDGRLVLIHTRGIVIRVHEPSGEYKNYYYEVGATFKDRVEVQADLHPEIDALLRYVLKT